MPYRTLPKGHGLFQRNPRTFGLAALLFSFGTVCRPARPHSSLGEINQVLLTVISNAVQSIVGGGEVTIATGEQDGFGCIELGDTSRGMTPEQVAGLFDSYFKEIEARIGVGMGLVHAQAVVERHQGRINVASRPGEGTQVRIELPVAAAASGCGEANASQFARSDGRPEAAGD